METKGKFCAQIDFTFEGVVYLEAKDKEHAEQILNEIIIKINERIYPEGVTRAGIPTQPSKITAYNITKY